MNGSNEKNDLWVRTFQEGARAGLSARAVLCAPFVYLSGLSRALEGLPIELGAQNVNENTSGAFTGEVSPAMLADLGVKWCIVGHSERRSLFGESDELVAKKAAALARAQIRPVLCVGETLEERQGGLTERVVLRQLDAVLERMPAGELGALAYEPVWAIGTGATATPEMAQAVHQTLRGRLREAMGEAACDLPILYGGSVKPSNAAELFREPDIDGGLIGGASLKADQFLQILSAR